MQWFLNQPLPCKLRLMFAVTLGSALLVVSVAFVIVQVYFSLRHETAQLRAVAGVIAANVSAAVEFDDEDTGAELLRSAFSKGNVTWAAIFKKGGDLYISATPPQAKGSLTAEAIPACNFLGEKVSLLRSQIDLAVPIIHGNQMIGCVYLRATLKETWQDIAVCLAAMFAAFVLAGGISAALAQRFHHALWSAISSLEETIRQILQTGDYSKRVTVSSRDELGHLGNQFNTLIEYVHHAQSALCEANEKLEERVRERTQELEQACQAAQAANRAKSAFLANMSHEIRTPMTAILGYLDFLSDENISSDERNTYLAIIRRNGEHLLALINDILDLSKIEAGKISLQSQVCQPLVILHDVVSLMRVKAEAKGLRLSVQLRGPVPRTIVTDPVRLRQILVNLVGNAIKFTDVGNVTLTAYLRWTEAGQKLCFDVKDTGPGIAEKDRQRIFEPFVQADDSLSRKHGGSGLGLTISRKLAQLLGGDITLETTVGQGSTFTLSIDPGPIDGVPMVSEWCPVVHDEKSRGTSTEPAFADGRVLLAEDGPDNQRLISFVLSKAGFEVTLAQNGQEAVNLYNQAKENGIPYDCILMDMQMPVMDGYTAVRQLRALGCQTPIIALTAHAMIGDREMCLEAGCDDYLSKPVERLRLIELVARYVARNRGGSLSQTAS